MAITGPTTFTLRNYIVAFTWAPATGGPWTPVTAYLKFKAISTADATAKAVSQNAILEANNAVTYGTPTLDSNQTWGALY